MVEDSHDAINDSDRPFLKDISYDPNKMEAYRKTLKQKNFQKI